MTCREWMQQNLPNLVNENYGGGVLGCPHEYGLAEKYPNRACTTIPCEACWDRQVTNPALIPSTPAKESPVDRVRLLIALECCRGEACVCRSCPYEHYANCLSSLAEDSLAYISYLEEVNGIGK